MITQGTEEWHAQRLGKVTASRLNDVMAKTKSGYSASRKNYMAELICEILSGERNDFFQNAAMIRGTELEPKARMYYEFENDCEVSEVGFIDHVSIPNFGASPDGLVGDDGLIEIKCPNTATHIEFIENGKPARKYVLQMHAQMMAAERKWCDFVSFDDRINVPALQFQVKRINFDEALAQEIKTEVEKFNEELFDKIESLINRAA